MFFFRYRLASSMLIMFFYFFSILLVKFTMPTWTLILLSIINDFTIMSTSRDYVIPSDVPEKWETARVGLASTTRRRSSGCHPILYRRVCGLLLSGGLRFIRGRERLRGRLHLLLDARSSRDARLRAILVWMAYFQLGRGAPHLCTDSRALSSSVRPSRVLL